MNRTFAAVALMLFPVMVLSGEYRAAALSADGFSMTITATDGSHFSAPKFADQVGFDQARVSPDGRYVGWLALYPNCCTSYPIPLRLVVLDQSRQMHTFDGIKIAIFSWCFVPHSASVAYTQSVLHGSNFQRFERREISDGRLLNEYEYPHEEAESAVARKRAPSWVSCVPE
jgi:hypothetical protein